MVRKTLPVVEKTQDYGLFADLLTFLAIFLAINTPDRGQNMTRHGPPQPLRWWGKIEDLRYSRDIVALLVLEQMIAQVFCGSPSIVTLISGVVFGRCSLRRVLPRVSLDDHQGTVSVVAGWPWKWTAIIEISGTSAASGSDEVTEMGGPRFGGEFAVQWEGKMLGEQGVVDLFFGLQYEFGLILFRWLLVLLCHFRWEEYSIVIS